MRQSRTKELMSLDIERVTTTTLTAKLLYDLLLDTLIEPAQSLTKSP